MPRLSFVFGGTRSRSLAVAGKLPGAVKLERPWTFDVGKLCQYIIANGFKACKGTRRLLLKKIR